MQLIFEMKQAKIIIWNTSHMGSFFLTFLFIYNFVCGNFNVLEFCLKNVDTSSIHLSAKSRYHFFKATE